MKTRVQLSLAVFVLIFSLEFSRAGTASPFNPMWNSAYKCYFAEIAALGCYNAGVDEMGADSARAVADFKAGLSYCGMAMANGGGQTAAQISQLISKQLLIASNQHNVSSKPVASVKPKQTHSIKTKPFTHQGGKKFGTTLSAGF